MSSEEKSPEPVRGRGRPPKYGASDGARQRSIYVSDAELAAVLKFLTQLRAKPKPGRKPRRKPQ